MTATIRRVLSSLMGGDMKYLGSITTGGDGGITYSVASGVSKVLYFIISVYYDNYAVNAKNFSGVSSTNFSSNISNSYFSYSSSTRILTTESSSSKYAYYLYFFEGETDSIFTRS